MRKLFQASADTPLSSTRAASQLAAATVGLDTSMLSIHLSSSRTTTFYFPHFLILCPYHCALRLTRLADLVIVFRYDWSVALDHWASLKACPLFVSILLADRTGLDWVGVLFGFPFGDSTGRPLGYPLGLQFGLF